MTQLQLPPRPSADAPALLDRSREVLSRRGLSRTALVGLAAAAAPVVAAEPAAAWTAKHAQECQHRHRCKKHPTHTCRHEHRCKHQHHKPRQSTPATSTPTSTPTPTPTTPTGPTTPTATPPPTPTTTPTPTGTPTPTTPVNPVIEDSAVPTTFGRHLGSRFAYGMTPALHRAMTAAGGPEQWFEQQLTPASVPDSEADAMQGWWPSIDADHTTIAQRDRDKVESGWSAMVNYGRWSLARRIHSNRQVLEVMAEFWENHLHVPLHDDGVFPYRAAYGKLLRSHALGRFDQMLLAATTHPAMGVSLDNGSSTKRAPNENLGRELLELHTVGRGSYTEDDIKASARILTGYRVATWSTWNVYYDTASHWTGPVQVMGFAHANADPDGRPVTEAYLTYLAHHPLTAARIARKLAVRFVSDQPSEQLVAHLAQVYLANGTAIVPVLRALVAHAEFRASAGLKVRTPTDDVVATYRALGVQLQRPTAESSAANAIYYQAAAVGQAPFGWARPDGQPQDNRSWSSASRVLASFQLHYGMAGRWWPKLDVVHREPISWLPTPGMRFDALVDQLCLQLLGMRAPSRLLQAACRATETGAGEAITASHAIVTWKLPILLTTLLDTPDHLHR